jgi:hypothetical protein
MRKWREVACGREEVSANEFNRDPEDIAEKAIPGHFASPFKLNRTQPVSQWSFDFFGDVRRGARRGEGRVLPARSPSDIPGKVG